MGRAPAGWPGAPTGHTPPPANAPAPNPTGPPSRKTLQEQILSTRHHLQDQDAFEADSRTLRMLGIKTLDRSEQLLRKKQLFAADRLLASAAAIQRAIEAAQRLSDASLAPSREHASQRLETVYFRAQQAEYFAQRSGEPDAASLPQIASRWYQKALRFLETDPGTSENYADAAASVVSALENLAQANVPAPGSGKAR